MSVFGCQISVVVFSASVLMIILKPPEVWLLKLCVLLLLNIHSPMHIFNTQFQRKMVFNILLLSTKMHNPCMSTFWHSHIIFMSILLYYITISVITMWVCLTHELLSRKFSDYIVSVMFYGVDQYGCAVGRKRSRSKERRYNRSRSPDKTRHNESKDKRRHRSKSPQDKDDKYVLPSTVTEKLLVFLNCVPHQDFCRLGQLSQQSRTAPLVFLGFVEAHSHRDAYCMQNQHTHKFCRRPVNGLYIKLFSVHWFVDLYKKKLWSEP